MSDIPEAVWAAVGAIIAAIVGGVFAWLRDHSTSRAAPYAELAKRVTTLEGEVDKLREHVRVRDLLAQAHTAWDMRVLGELAQLDPNAIRAVGDPPPLFPPTDHPSSSD